MFPDMVSVFIQILEALPHKPVTNNVFEAAGTHVIRVRWIRAVAQRLVLAILHLLRHPSTAIDDNVFTTIRL